MGPVGVNHYVDVAEVTAVSVGSHLLHAFLDALHQHKRVHGVETCADQRMMQLLDKPDDLVGEQITMVLKGNLHAIVLDERNILLELVDAIGQLDNNVGMHAGAVNGLWTLDIQAELHQLRTDSVTNVQ